MPARADERSTTVDHPSPPRWHVRHPGGCIQPVLLRGRVDHIDGATGELLHRYSTVHEPGGVLPVACKTRRASRCPPCAEVYSADTYQLIRAGLSGGKGVPDSVATHPCVFTTLTAPSFGPVHLSREKEGQLLRCRPRRRGQICPHGRRMSCADRHARDDARLGEPLCPDCYDYTGSVLFNACAPELWRRFTITLRRALARQAGLTNKALAAQVRVSFAKVAEYQRRGVVHFHAIIRLDGPNGPATPPPAWATLGLLTAAIAQAADAVHLDTPAAPGLPARTLAGAASTTPGRSPPPGNSPTPGSPPTSPSTPPRPPNAPAPSTAASPPPTSSPSCPSASTPAASSPPACASASSPELEDLRLAAWAHMLGFRGHFSTKSRHYSTTFGALRAERAQHQRDHAPTDSLWPEPDDDTTLVLAHWRFAGQGHPPTTAPIRRRHQIRRPTTQPARGRPAMTRLLLTVPEAAEALAISRSKLYQLIASGAVDSILIGGSRRIPLTALEAYISRLLAERTAA